MSSGLVNGQSHAALLSLFKFANSKGMHATCTSSLLVLLSRISHQHVYSIYHDQLHVVTYLPTEFKGHSYSSSMPTMITIIWFNHQITQYNNIAGLNFQVPIYSQTFRLSLNDALTTNNHNNNNKRHPIMCGSYRRRQQTVFEMKKLIFRKSSLHDRAVGNR